MLTLYGTLRRSSLAFAVAALFAATSPSHAFDRLWTGGGGDGSWNTDANWDQNFPVPDVGFNEVAIINNGDVVSLNAPAVTDAAGLTVANEAGSSGSLIIGSGGSLTLLDSGVAAGDGELPTTGAANIGFEGGTGDEGDSGLIEVQGGGAFAAALFDINQNGVLRIGTGTGSASASTSGNVFSNGTIGVNGAGHTISIGGNLTLEEKAEGSSRYAPTITGTGNSVINVAGAVSLGGALTPVFDGFTPQLGDRWDLIDAASIQGSLDVTASQAGAGTAFTTRVVDSGSGQILQLALEAVLTLKVNGSTGAMSLLSETGESIDMVGYSILSSNGFLNPATWNSLEDQGVAGFEEAAATAVGIHELNAENSLAVSDTPFDLGSSILSFSEFGRAADIAFDYAVDGGQTSVPGNVVYEGDLPNNNLLLTVDPSTGEAQLKNDSQFTVDIVAYSVASQGGSLDASGWDSLESQAVSGWDDADVSSDEFLVGEFVPEDPAAMLTPGQAFSLGDLFQVGGSQDLELEFGLVVDGIAEVWQGVVEYGEISDVVGLPGDFNNDGVVNAIDYAVWRDNLGAADESGIANNGDGGGVTASDYQIWQSNFGASGANAAAASASVPEPSAIAAALGAMLTMAGVRAGRKFRCVS